MQNKLEKIKINNKNYGKLKGTIIFITSLLKKNLLNIKSNRYGNVFIKIETVGFRGGKHLIEQLKNKIGKDCELILTHESSAIRGKKIFLNFESYDKYGRSKFFSVYRQTGLETSLGYLQRTFPDLFGDVKIEPTRSETRKVIDSLPQISPELYNRETNTLIKNVVGIIQNSDTDLSKLTPEVLNEINAASNQVFYRRKIKEFLGRLKKDYPETKGDNSWQNWIYKNAWLLGSKYLRPITKKRVGLDAIPDFLFPTVDNFLDILEIKLPKEQVIVKDRSHPDSFYWSDAVSKALGQIINYLYQLEINQFQIAKKLKVSIIKPRAILLIGKSDAWNEEFREAFRKLNYSLHGIEVVTYTQLLQYGNRLLEIYDKDKKIE